MIAVISMIAVGAVIGFGTNLLAIVMLFRPWTEWRIGSFTVPLTPGLIPKRQADIAKQLGEVVEEHLVTEEGIVTSLSRPEWITELRSYLVNAIEQTLATQRTVRDLYIYLTGNAAEQLADQLEQWATVYWRQKMMPILEMKQVRDILPVTLQSRVRQEIPVFSDKLLEKAGSWIDSEEVRDYLASAIQEQLLGKGMIGKMAGMFVQEDRIVNEVIPHLQNWLDHPATSELVQKKLFEEWDRLLERPAAELLTDLKQAWEPGSANETSSRLLGELLDKLLSIDLYQVWLEHQPNINQKLDEWIRAAQLSSVKWVKPLLASLRIRDMVERQVSSFPIPKLERIVIDVVRKELSMITWLGALLGGLIGLIQALLLVGWR